MSLADGKMLWNYSYVDYIYAYDFDDSEYEYYDDYYSYFYSMEREQFWTLNDIGGIIDQFNYVGFHDICNYPEPNELELYITQTTKTPFLPGSH